MALQSEAMREAEALLQELLNWSNYGAAYNNRGQLQAGAVATTACESPKIVTGMPLR